MSDIAIRVAVFILAVAFAATPFLSSGIGGFPRSDHVDTLDGI